MKITRGGVLLWISLTPPWVLMIPNHVKRYKWNQWIIWHVLRKKTRSISCNANVFSLLSSFSGVRNRRNCRFYYIPKRFSIFKFSASFESSLKRTFYTTVFESNKELEKRCINYIFQSQPRSSNLTSLIIMKEISQKKFKEK